MSRYHDEHATGQAVYLRRQAGPSRLTIFEGTHEWLPAVAVAWLADHRKDDHVAGRYRVKNAIVLRLAQRVREDAGVLRPPPPGWSPAVDGTVNVGIEQDQQFLIEVVGGLGFPGAILRSRGKSSAQ